MSEFLAQYGLWLLIALLVVIVIVYLLSGEKKGAPPAVGETKTAPPPVPEMAIAEEADTIPAAREPIEPVTLASGAATTIVTPVPETSPEAIPGSPVLVETQVAADNLLLLKGVGPKLNTLLIELGVTRFAQIAEWTDADLAAIDARLGTFKGRPVRDHWIDQAKYLAANDIAGFEAKYGKI